MNDQTPATPLRIDADRASGTLRLGWADGHATAFDAVPLRWLCPCAYCRGEAGMPGWLEGGRRRKERAVVEDDFEASLLRLQAAQKSYDLERRELRGRKKFEMVRGAMVGEVSEDSYAAASSGHKKVSVKIDAVLAWAAAARAAESEACSRPERRRAALRFAAKWTGICLAAAVLLAGAYYFAFLAAP